MTIFIHNILFVALWVAYIRVNLIFDHSADYIQYLETFRCSLSSSIIIQAISTTGVENTNNYNFIFHVYDNFVVILRSAYGHNKCGYIFIFMTFLMASFDIFCLLISVYILYAE